MNQIPDPCRIFRMTHYKNLSYIFREGLLCSNSEIKDPSFIPIGHRTLIAMRGHEAVSIAPFGVLNDYVPFYFHYKMPMLYQIANGEVPDFAGSQNEIVYLCSDMKTISAHGLPFIFTDRHAYLHTKGVYNNMDDLNRLNWDVILNPIMQGGYSALKKEYKQAELLVYRHFPIVSITGIVCCTEPIATFVRDELKAANISIPVVVRPDFYYL